jgi:SAM-dependent methyltransferase
MRLARLRWARSAGADRVADWKGSASALAVVDGVDAWTVVRDAAALPLSPAEGSVCHTLRELEAAPRGIPQAGSPVAVAFRVSDLPPEPWETVEGYVSRLLDFPASRRLAAFVIGNPSERERPEVTSRLPEGPARILDAGCGSGGLALARPRRPGWNVTGIEKDPRQAARARDRCDVVIEGDLAEVLPRLSAAGERFDAIVFADVLEHLEDPVAALAQARRLASPDGVLVASVPNVGHVSVVRDLLLGRHDPVPAGLCDAGHLRWFTRSSFAEMIAEAGWSLESLDGEGGAPAPDREPFLELVAQWPDADRESLETYQWIAKARAR